VKPNVFAGSGWLNRNFTPSGRSDAGSMTVTRAWSKYFCPPAVSVTVIEVAASEPVPKLISRPTRVSQRCEVSGVLGPTSVTSNTWTGPSRPIATGVGRDSAGGALAGMVLGRVPSDQLVAASTIAGACATSVC